MVPQGDEGELFPVFQDAVKANFGILTRWEDEERDVLVLSSNRKERLTASTSSPMFQFMRGKITLKSQPILKLADALPNWLGKIVVDETGLEGSYDFDLEYRAGDSGVLIDALRNKYGLILAPGKRKVQILIVEKKAPDA